MKIVLIIKAITPLMLAILGVGLEIYGINHNCEKIEQISTVLVGAAAGLAVSPNQKPNEPI